MNTKKIIRSIIIGLLLFPAVVFAQPIEDEPVRDDDFFRGKVQEVLAESAHEDFGFVTIVQEIRVSTSEEEVAEVTITNEFALTDQEQREVKKGSRIVVGKSYVGGEIRYYVSDVYRVHALLYILAIFALLTFAITRMQGVRAFIGLALSFLVIGWYIVPQILAGSSPVFVALIGTIGIASLSIFIAHGFHARTTVAFISTVVTICAAVWFGSLSVSFVKLFGFGTEEAFFLQSAGLENIDLRGLLLAGMIIGTLGVLDDITTAQAAVVEQLHRANITLKFRELYNRGLAVGKEHIVSLVNTLILAYTGASLPLLLLFSIYKRPLWVTLNSEIMMEEVIRMLVGSITLVIAVPITTYLAALYFHKRPVAQHDGDDPHIHIHHH